MEYVLMHKELPVLSLELSDASGRVVQIGQVHSHEHLPTGVARPGRGDAASMDSYTVNKWWQGRSIPAKRSGIADVLSRLSIGGTSLLAAKCFGLSLSDQYWLCPKGQTMRWREINFFDNGFSEDLGELLLGKYIKPIEDISLMSPDSTSDGVLQKKWLVIDGKQMLMKGASHAFRQQPYNEAIAAAVCEALGIAHTNYRVVTDGDEPYSLCEDFVTKETELVPAYRVTLARKKGNSDSELTHLLKCTEALGIPDPREAINKMLVLDYIIANQDRHYNNFGFLRNADTLEWIGAAPIYDSGNSLWHDGVLVGEKAGAKPFKRTHAEQIGLVDDWSWLKSASTGALASSAGELLLQSQYQGEARVEQIRNALRSNLEQIAIKASAC